ncbi:hypothetical protein [Streptomyces sp. NPDC012825]|uniref:hypothetical protein n=1 Tax=Streptomyces sp. NPDC012825 TaxID=3364851 RepID=UPI00369C0187
MNSAGRALAQAGTVERGVDYDTDPVTGAYPDEARLALLTAAEAHETIGHLQLLEQLDPGGRGPAAGQLAADLARRLPALSGVPGRS